MRATPHYHHGDLRAALLKTAHIELERAGYADLSLRALAAKLGVAPSAPYNHFKSRDALLAALVADGSSDLARRYTAVARSPDDPQCRLERACLAYLSFANERPHLFRLMFVADIQWQPKFDTGDEDCVAAYPLFETLIAATMPGADSSTTNAKALAVWAMLHGMAMLSFNDRLTRRYIAGQSHLSVIRALLLPG